MTQEQIIKLDKVASKKLQFVQAATSTDDARPVLQRISVNDEIVAADGFRLHAIESTGNEDFDNLGGVVDIAKLKAGINYIEPVKREGEQDKFPEYKQIIPQIQGGVMVAINARFLLDIAKYADKGQNNPLYIMIHGNDKPVEIKGTCQGDDFYALVMPLNCNQDSYYQKFQPRKAITAEENARENGQDVKVSDKVSDIARENDTPVESTPDTVICDNCLTAAYDEGAKGLDMQIDVCMNLGADIADHKCESYDTDVKCNCACRSN